MSSFKISVAMAIFNGEKYIKKQLESILNQTIVPDEVIIIDDCSTDRTVEVVENYVRNNQLSFCKLFVNSINLGYKKNFYRALSKTSGDIIFLSDQDDEWEKNKLKKIIDVFKENQDVLAVNSAVKYIDERSNPFSIKSQKNYYNANFLYSRDSIKKITYFDKNYISKHNISPGCSMAFRKSILEDFLKIYDFRMPHDWFINLIAAYKGGCVFFDETLTKYRIHSSNVIGSNTSIRKGIVDKTNSFRIEDYENRIASIIIIDDYFSDNSDIENIKLLYSRMIDFYKKPNLKQLFILYKTDGYFELAKRKVRVWDFIIALHLDSILRALLK